MVTRVKLESTLLYIMPILAETLEVCGSICQEKKMVEIRFRIKAQCFDKLYSVPITDFPFGYTYAEYIVHFPLVMLISLFFQHSSSTINCAFMAVAVKRAPLFQTNMAVPCC